MPLRTPSGEVFLVDRGWLPGDRTGAGPDAVPQPPAGQVQVTARLRSSEPPSDQGPHRPGHGDRRPESVDRPQGTHVSGLRDPRSGGARRWRPLRDRCRILISAWATHLAYALQWWVFALGGFVLFGYFAVREVRTATCGLEA